jgi:hypothetical protein
LSGAISHCRSVQSQGTRSSDCDDLKQEPITTVKAVVSWLRPKQQEKKLLDFVISLPDGTRINVDPPDRAATITVSFASGRVESITYSADQVDPG